TPVPHRLLRGGREPVLAARHQREVGSCLGERHRDLLPNATGGPSDECLLTGQIEKGHPRSSHSVGSGYAAGFTRRTISPRTVRTAGSPTHKCFALAPPISSACGTRANLARASSGRR